MKTGSLSNSFSEAIVSCQVNVDGTSFNVTNNGNVDAYIRAYIVVNWTDSDGNVRGIVPVAGLDYELTVNTTNWYLDEATGVYYHRTAIAAGGDTNDLITGIVEKQTTPPSGYVLTVELVAEAIQAEGVKDGTSDTAFQDAWGIIAIGD